MEVQMTRWPCSWTLRRNCVNHASHRVWPRRQPLTGRSMNFTRRLYASWYEVYLGLNPSSAKLYSNFVWSPTYFRASPKVRSKSRVWYLFRPFRISVLIFSSSRDIETLVKLRSALNGSWLIILKSYHPPEPFKPPWYPISVTGGDHKLSSLPRPPPSLLTFL